MKKSKRTLALVLSACMAFALFATIPAPDSAQAIFNDAGELSYTFNTVALSADEAVATFASISKTYAYLHATGTEAATSVTELSPVAEALTYDRTYSKGNKRSPWKASSVYVSSVTARAEATEDKPDINSGSPTWARIFNSYGIGVFSYGNVKNRRAMAGVTIKVEEGEGGWYKAVASYIFPTKTTDNSALNFNLYDGLAADGVKKVDGASASAKVTGWTNAELGVAYFAPGEYEFTMEMKTSGAASSGTNKDNLAYIRNVKLIPVECPYSLNIISADENIADYTLDAGETANVTVAVLNGETAVDGVEFTAVSDSAAASVAVEGNVVTVTANEAGTANITVSAVVNGGSVAVTVPVTVNAKEEVVEKSPYDINGDGRVNTRDIVALRQYVANN